MTNDISAAQRRLLDLAGRHQSEMRAAIENANTDADEAYRIAGLHVGLRGDAALSALGHGLATIVQRVREHSDDMAVSHVLSELRAAVGTGANGISIAMPPRPSKRDVAEYVENCIDATREAIKGAEAADRPALIAKTVYRAHTVIESETDSRYETARQACLKSLQSMSDEQTRRLGFAIARSTDQFRSVDGLQVRGESQWIPIVGMRWDARADACQKCRAAHGELRPLGFSFSLPGPTAHARCQCITSLWVVAFEVERGARLDTGHEMADKTSHRDNGAEPGDHHDRAGLAFNVRSLELRKENIDEATRTIRGAIASDESEDSHGSVIKAKGWDLESRFASNPVLLWNHPVGGGCFAPRAEPEDVLGTVDATVKGKQLIVDLHFAPASINPKADQVFRMMTANPPIIRALSVGFAPKQYHYEKRGEGGDELLVIDEAQLYEVSVLPIGSNVNTLARGLRALCDVANVNDPGARGAVPYKAHPVKESGKWDAAAAKKRVKAWAGEDAQKLRSAYAWFDSDKPENESSFKLPHHDIVDGEMVTSCAGVIAAGNACMGSRGGVDIPESEMGSVKAHLAKHYKQCDTTPPWESEKAVEAIVTGAGAAHACRSPSQEKVMSDQNTEVQGVALSVLPAEIAARLGVDSIDKAVAAIDKRDLTIDKLTKDLAAVIDERKALADKIEKREAEDAAKEVDGLIKDGRIDAAKREMALRSFKADPEAFRNLYPEKVAPPQARKLEVPASLPADTNTPSQPLAENPINKRAAVLIKGGAPYVEAWSQAMNEYQSAQLGQAISG